MNCAGNQCPASGAFGNAFVSAPFNAGALNVGSHMQSKPLPSLLSTCWLAPSDSPGGLTHTNASMCAKPVGVVAGRSPIPAPFWLHHAPRCGRRSTREALINVLRSVEVLAAVGRTPPAGGFVDVTGQFAATVQPQPLREMSISIPSVVGNRRWRPLARRHLAPYRYPHSWRR